MENKSTLFLKEIDSLSKKEIPKNVMDRAKQSLLDYIAVTFAGSQFQKEIIRKYCDFSEPEDGKYTSF